MKHEPGDERHSIWACEEACSAGGPGARWEDGSREKQHRKEKTEKWKTRAEIRKEAGTKGRGGGQRGKEKDCRAPPRHKSPSWELSLAMNHLNF